MRHLIANIQSIKALGNIIKLAITLSEILEFKIFENIL